MGADVREYIDRSLAKPLTVAQLAKRAKLSPYHFIRAFRAQTGQTPHQYGRMRRIERAQHLLATTPMAVTDVCEAVSFQSFGSFSSIFRRMTGHTPTAYRAGRPSATGFP